MDFSRLLFKEVLESFYSSARARNMPRAQSENDAAREKPG
jgi:hypothetical protein